MEEKKLREFKRYAAKVNAYDVTDIENGRLLGVLDGKPFSLPLDYDTSDNTLVIGGTGTGKTFKYIKPNILQENCSMVVTDPSGDIFKSFAPYLLQKGYNVYQFNLWDFGVCNNYNPLDYCFDNEGRIDPIQIDALIDIYMKFGKENKEMSGGDPFWNKVEKAFLVSLVYYVLEEDEDKLRNGFTLADGSASMEGFEGGRCFGTILKLVQEFTPDDNGKRVFDLRLTDFFARKPENETHLYYNIFMAAPEKTLNAICICTAVDLQIFSIKEVDMATRTNTKYPDMNIDFEKIASQQSYLFLGIPQSHQAFNFLIEILYFQLYYKLYNLGEKKMRGKWHIGYKIGTPVFAPFESEADAIKFYETIQDSCIIENDYVQGTKIYSITMPGSDVKYKTSVIRGALEKLIADIDKMYIWQAEEFVKDTPALPMHVTFMMDEFRNIGKIPYLPTFLSTSRKYRIGTQIIIQSISQLKAMYKDDEYKAILDNVDSIVFLGSFWHEDNEFIKELLESNKENAPLLEDIEFTDDDEIVFDRNRKALLCKKLNLFEHKNWKVVEKARNDNLDIVKYYMQ